MMKAAAERQPRIERKPEVRGGAPVVAGTGIRVLDVAVRYEVMGMTPDEIVSALRGLTLPQVHAALSYYYAHKGEMDREWKASLKQIDTMRRRTISRLERKLGPAKALCR